MSLTPGQSLSSYEILSLLGKGGMGEVYRARDTKLDRDVAIKVLPEEFAKDEERLLRFQREAKLLASPLLDLLESSAQLGIQEKGVRLLWHDSSCIDIHRLSSTKSMRSESDQRSNRTSRGVGPALS